MFGGEVVDRTILHIDGNNFYASVECLYNPELRGKPMAVAGDPLERHGIILAKSQEAKKCGVTTGHPIWKALQLCPELVLVDPHYDLYLKHSRLAKEIYKEYTDQVETLGLDEAWLDVTGSQGIFGDGRTIAHTIRKRITRELGITVSVGVSWNKIFAKLGSDYKKPDAVTCFNHADLESVIWRLPACDMWGVGWATMPQLAKYGIYTIGDLAKTDYKLLESWFGKNGLMLWSFANGHDTSPVVDGNYIREIKSVGNTTTTPKDLETDQQIKITLYLLAESVAERMRDQNFKCRTVQLWIRYDDMSGCERQATMPYAISNSDDIFALAYELLRKHRNVSRKIRGLGVRGCNLTGDAFIQESFLPEKIKSQRRDDLEDTIDSLRHRFGHFIVQRGLQLTDTELSHVDPKNEHVGFMNV